MSRVTLHFPRKAKAILYGNLLLSLVTGLSWFSLHRWWQIEGEFGPEINPVEPWLMKVHGASAFLALIGFGYLLATHIHIGLKSKRNRLFGLSLVWVMGLMVLSGYLLYYVSNEDFRQGVSWVHLILGILFPIILILHITVGKKKSRR